MAQKIILDCLGGDGGIDTMLAGAVEALTADPNLEMILVGDENIIRPKLAELDLTARAEIVHTTENIPLTESPTEAIKKRTGSSIVLGLDKLKTREDCGAFVSTGSTGAVLTGGFLKMGRIPGVIRPALCPNLPTKTGVPTMLIDTGANVDCKPEHLVHFAVMASEYKKACGVKKPRVSLLNIGAEAAKGNDLAKQTYALLTKLHDKGLLNFVGNLEANHVLAGETDVIVTDGFAGNVLLKCIEGVTKFLFGTIKQVLSSGVRAKVAGLLAGGKIKKVKAAYIDDAQAASIFLGLKKPVIKAHGNADVKTVAGAIAYANTVIGLDLSDKIEAAIAAAEKVIADNEAHSV